MARAFSWSFAIALIASVGLAAPADARALIVRSSGPSAPLYPAGKVLSDGAVIQLAQGDVLTVIGENRARDIRGPGTFRAAGANPAQAGQRGRFGARRSVKVLPKPWYADASKGGTLCVANSSELELWRPDSSRDTTLVITGADGKTASVVWPAGRDRIAWPSDLSAQNGAEYQVRFSDKSEINHVKIAAVSKSANDMLEAAQILMENGCDSQLDLLISAAREEG